MEVEPDANVRVEAYRKDYRELVDERRGHVLRQRRHGYARGVDVFLQRLAPPLAGWVSYGYLDTRRRELDDPREVPAVYGVRHSLTLVGQYAVTPSWQVGARYRRHHRPALHAGDRRDLRRGARHLAPDRTARTTRAGCPTTTASTCA